MLRCNLFLIIYECFELLGFLNGKMTFPFRPAYLKVNNVFVFACIHSKSLPHATMDYERTPLDCERIGPIVLTISRKNKRTSSDCNSNKENFHILMIHSWIFFLKFSNLYFLAAGTFFSIATIGVYFYWPKKGSANQIHLQSQS